MKNYDEILGNIATGIFKNNQEFKRERDAIRANENLSPKGKEEELTDLFKRYVKRHKQLKAELEGERGKLKKELSKNVYAPGSKNITAFNSALDRLDGIKHEDELNKIIDRAEKIDDEITLQAASLFSIEKGYGNALSRIKEILPDKAEAMSHLADFEMRWGDARGKGTILQERIFTSGPQRPEEVPHAIIAEI